MFSKILIANRGEIACRVMKTCRRMSIQTVAVYSDADRLAPHVKMADEAVHIGPAPSNQSYLLADRIVEACRQTGAQAVHPGYGFLSEKREFQEALAEAGIAFIGPDAHAIFAMGDKIESKKLAKAANVSTVPGHLGVIEDADEAVRVAREIGYPVMIKASAGGGGKGMRLAHDDAEAREGYVSARNEARSSFADDRVFVEKFILSPRHIEIQILADKHGTVLYLGERECSIQRRHQKVIEEAPSPFLTPETRKAMGEQACALARAVGYHSAGTVEFIVDGTTGQFYFLEMNTRLQVEHPVTEMVTGLDLVEWMIRIADGEKLGFTQDEVTLNGWAIEARVCAEDPVRNFLPSTGRLTRYRPPPVGRHVRVDTGVEEGGAISVYYDPMIAKLIAWGETREAATAHLKAALDQYVIHGVSHNIGFLTSVLGRERFAGGVLSTAFIAQEYPDGFCPATVPEADRPALIAVAAVVARKTAEREATISGQFPGHDPVVREDWVVVIGDDHHPVTIRPLGGGYGVTMGDRVVRIESDWRINDPLLRAVLDGRLIAVQVDRAGSGWRLTHNGSQIKALVLSPRGAELQRHMLKKAPPDRSKFLLSPMPGLLVSLAVDTDREVEAGETLAVVEAMKMENVLKAERGGRVVKVHAKPGDSLAVDQIILEFA